MVFCAALRSLILKLSDSFSKEYVSDPLLVTPSSQSATAQSTSETLSSLSLNENPSTTDGPRKFHLRAYVLCVGGLRVYLYDEMLALFAPLAYEAPRLHDDQDASEGAAQNGNTGGPDLRRHLTNTCLQEDGSLGSGRPSEQNVYLWSDLAGSSASQSGRNNPMSNLSEEDVTNVKKMAAQVIGDTFGAAARAGSVHWQMWPNCWEIFGVDLLVGWDEKKGDADIKTDSGTDAGRKEHGGKSLRVWLLEINAVSPCLSRGPVAVLRADSVLCNRH